MPTDIKPYFYELKLKPYIGTNELYGNKSFSFEGHVNISLICINQTDQIILHQKELNILNVTISQIYPYLTKSSNSSINVVSLSYDNKREFLIVQLENVCVKNYKYKMQISYTGNITDSLAGFYRSSYFDSNGTVH